MKKHPIKIEGFAGEVEELGRQVGRMRYDKVVEFLAGLEKEIIRQAEGDRTRGRVQLAGMLDDITGDMEGLRIKMEHIFALCKPFMKDEIGGES